MISSKESTMAEARAPSRSKATKSVGNN